MDEIGILKRSGAFVLTVTLALTATLAGCGGGGGDKASEALAEKVAEQGAGGDVDLNSDDGTIKYTDEEGNVSELNVDGAGTDLPEDWPTELAPPESVKLLTATTNTVDGVKSLYVLGETDGTVEDLIGGLKTQVEGAGFEITNDSSMTGSGGAFSSLTATSADWDLNANVTEGETDGKVTVTIGLTEKSAG